MPKYQQNATPFPRRGVTTKKARRRMKFIFDEGAFVEKANNSDRGKTRGKTSVPLPLASLLSPREAGTVGSNQV